MVNTTIYYVLIVFAKDNLYIDIIFNKLIYYLNTYEMGFSLLKLLWYLLMSI